MEKKYSEMIEENYEEIINLAVRLMEEYSSALEGWHSDICLDKDGYVYETGLVNGGVSMDVHNGNAIVVLTVRSQSNYNIEDYKEVLDYAILECKNYEQMEGI